VQSIVSKSFREVEKFALWAIALSCMKITVGFLLLILLRMSLYLTILSCRN